MPGILTQYCGRAQLLTQCVVPRTHCTAWDDRTGFHTTVQGSEAGNGCLGYPRWLCKCMEQKPCDRTMMRTSTSRVHRDHSSWQAVIGCTACARLISSAEASEMPRYFTFPSFTSSCIHVKGSGFRTKASSGMQVRCLAARILGSPSVQSAQQCVLQMLLSDLLTH